MSTTPAEQDAEWAEWFNALSKNKQARVREALAGESTELDLSRNLSYYGRPSKFTHIPRRLFTDCPALTKINLWYCSYSRRCPTPSASCWR